jgi:hypothetical protein
VSGAVTAGSVGAGSFSTGGTLLATGTITTNSQFIGAGTGLTGTASSLTVGVATNATNATNAVNATNATNAVNATNASNASNVTGASQPTITSLGTLISLAISGDLDVNGIPNFNQGLYMVIPTRTSDPSTVTTGSFYLRLNSNGSVSGLRGYSTTGGWTGI